MRVTRAVAVLSMAAVLGLSACTSDSEAKPERGSESGQSTESAAPAEEGGDFDLTAEDVVARITAASQAAGSVRTEMTTTTQGQTMTASGVLRYGADAQEMAMTMDIPGTGAVEMRVVGGLVYMSMADLTQGKFIEIDPADTSNPLSAAFAPMMAQMDPAAQVKSFEGAIVSLEKVGEPEEKAGALAQAYEMTVDSAVGAAQLGSTPEQLGMPATVTSTYWIDADDQIRMIESDMAGTTLRMSMSEWGEPVEITAPTAEEITELPGF
jgi:hypothetical protein